MTARLTLLAAMAAAILVPSLPAGAGAAERAKLAEVIAIEGAIGPATARQVHDGLATAADRNAEAVVLEIDTPGGLVTSMREIIADILASPVPVIGYVAPSGAHAASAGTYILYATHIAAMAPGTNLGAATPVELGGPMPGLPGGEKKNDKGGEPAPPGIGAGDAMTAKMTNDAAAFIRSLAELRGRNADWAERAVREAASLSADAALKERVVDLVAADRANLLQKVDGRVVALPGGVSRTLATRDVAVEVIEPGWLIRFLSVITSPDVAVILLLVGAYGLVLELSSPGVIAPGVIGTISLLLGLYALNLLPIDYAGLALILIGIVFLMIEAFNPTVVLGLGGLGAFLLGLAMLFRAQAPGFELSWPVIGIAVAMILGLTLFVGRSLVALRGRPSRVGGPAMRGTAATVLDWRSGHGHVTAFGERWNAAGEGPFIPGETVEVADIDGLTLTVRRAAAGRTTGPSDGEIR